MKLDQNTQALLPFEKCRLQNQCVWCLRKGTKKERTKKRIITYENDHEFLNAW